MQLAIGCKTRRLRQVQCSALTSYKEYIPSWGPHQHYLRSCGICRSQSEAAAQTVCQHLSQCGTTLAPFKAAACIRYAYQPPKHCCLCERGTQPLPDRTSSPVPTVAHPSAQAIGSAGKSHNNNSLLHRACASCTWTAPIFPNRPTTPTHGCHVLGAELHAGYAMQSGDPPLCTGIMHTVHEGPIVCKHEPPPFSGCILL